MLWLMSGLFTFSSAVSLYLFSVLMCLHFISCLFTFLFSLHWNENTEPMIIKSLGRLALHNDTLLDLSGEHFNLTDFLPASALLSPKALSPLEEGDAAAAADPRQVRFLSYFILKICAMSYYLKQY